tara:strand:- start:1743 stop:2459 length:717 start_codon:yes stop_codon:yes gene_type:complete
MMNYILGFLLILISCDSFSLQRRQLVGSAFTPSIQMMINSKKPNEIGEVTNNQPQIKDDDVGILQESFNEIYFYAPVSQRSCFELKKLLMDADVKMKTLSIQYNIPSPPIHLHIQTQGGSLYHTLYIIDLIQKLDSDVYTYVDGFAASAGTLMSVVGKKRFMTNHSLMLIHQLSGADSGKFNELQDQMSNMNILMSMILDVYLKHTTMNKETLQELLQKDLWLDSETCLKYGLVDEII